jgi:G3E family GTPase
MAGDTERRRIPVHLITGFLGAGKTTFLNHLIRTRLPERILVVENEVGDVNIDGALIVDGAESVVELTAGCICCSLNDELHHVLAEISARSEQFDRVVIETTGIADPGSVAQVLLSSPADHFFELKNIICLADACHLDEALRDTDEARRQIAAADLILINKADLVEPARLISVTEAVRGINPLADVRTGEQGIFDVQATLDNTTIEHIGAQTQVDQVPADHGHIHHDITSFSLCYEVPFDLKKLSHELLVLLNIYRHQVYRVKGIVATQDNPVQVVIQSVRNQLSLTDGLLWPPEKVPLSKVVFIGKGVHRRSIERILNNCLVKPAKLPVKPDKVNLSRHIPPAVDANKLKFGYQS